MSNGAVMAGHLAWLHPERLAAVAQVSGTSATALPPGTAAAMPVALLNIHGTRDRVAPYAGGHAALMWRLLMRGRATASMGVDEWARVWVARNGAQPEPATAQLGLDVAVRTWRGSTPESDIVFYRIEGAGHTWPGVRTWSPPHLGRVSRTIDATALSWDFLSAHSRR
jgi:polyhydroxybutyrate depolymerase